MPLTHDIETEKDQGREHIESALQAAEAKRDALDGERRELAAHIRGLRASLRGLEEPKDDSDFGSAEMAWRIAGPTAVNHVLATFRRSGKPLSQAEVTRRTGRHSGTVSWAIRALLADDYIFDTHQKDGRSRIFELVKDGPEADGDSAE